jgi:hypothetical protein
MLCVVAMLGGIYAGMRLQNLAIRPTAIEHNCAQYNPKTGAFEWLDVIPPIDVNIMNVPIPEHRPALDRNEKQK